MATATRKRTSFRANVGTTGVVYVKMIKSSINAINETLGWIEDEDGEPPQGKVILGEGREDALKAGCFPLAIYYRKNKKLQRAVVLVSPEKADTAAKELVSKTYAGNPIVKVRPVARRKLVI
ncbi:MAG TPA: hypothetical protein VK203_28420 [Nostocaceae cyanobacterium]|nr:hypothetical protein [Nostocaceae cyanobacterium]